jgi:hypothetical protein
MADIQDIIEGIFSSSEMCSFVSLNKPSCVNVKAIRKMKIWRIRWIIYNLKASRISASNFPEHVKNKQNGLPHAQNVLPQVLLSNLKKKI